MQAQADRRKWRKPRKVRCARPDCGCSAKPRSRAINRTGHAPCQLERPRRRASRTDAASGRGVRRPGPACYFRGLRGTAASNCQFETHWQHRPSSKRIHDGEPDSAWQPNLNTNGLFSIHSCPHHHSQLHAQGPGPVKWLVIFSRSNSAVCSASKNGFSGLFTCLCSLRRIRAGLRPLGSHASFCELLLTAARVFFDPGSVGRIAS